MSDQEQANIILRIDPQLKVKFQIVALQENTTMSALLREFIEACVDKLGDQ